MNTKFQNKKVPVYEPFTKSLSTITLDKNQSKVSIESYLNIDNKIGMVKLIGKYPYKGKSEAKYIINETDLFIEETKIRFLIIDATKFCLSTDCDNDLSDLYPVHQSYFKSRALKVFILANHDNIAQLSDTHNMDDLFLDMDEILKQTIE